MTNHDLIQPLSLQVFHAGKPHSLQHGFCGDLLSSVLVHAPAHCAWITVMCNVNVAAVAVMRQVGCVLLAQGVSPDGELLARAESEGLCLLGSQQDMYTLAVRLAALLDAP